MILHSVATKNTRTRPASIHGLFGSVAPLRALLLMALALMASSVAETKAEAEASAKSATETQCPQSTAQSVWIISTRNAPLCNRRRVIGATLDYWRMDIDEDGCRHWLASDKDEFHGSARPGIPTCFHIHGNRTSHRYAISEGLGVLECLENQAHGQQFRMVIWSWPSGRTRGLNRNDARVKAARSDVQAYYFARCTRRLNPHARVGMIGYSFGARVITGALEMLAGGCIAGYRLDMQEENPQEETVEETSPTTLGNLPRIRIVLIASATDRCWLLPGRRYGSALDLVDWALVTRNSRDPVLRWYPKMYGFRGPQATGFAGPALTCEQRQKTEVLNLSCAVGKSHEWQRYLCSLRLYWRLGECLFVGDTIEAESGPEKE